MVMPPPRQSQSSKGSSLLRSWTLAGVIAFIALQLLTTFVAFTRFDRVQYVDDIELKREEPKSHGGGMKLVQIIANDIRFSVKPVGGDKGDKVAKTIDPCIQQPVSPGYCLRERKGNVVEAELERETCTFKLENSDVVFGVWHSLATEGRLQPLLETWGAQARIVLLASTVGAKKSKIFQEGEPGSRPHLLGEMSK